jgi:GxxExxY protein
MNADQRQGAELLHQKLTHRVIGRFFDVYNELGYGFLESVYASALEVVLHDTGISFRREPSLDVFFRGRRIAHFKPDFLIEGVVLVELKATPAIHPASVAQVLNYLRASEIEIALLLNFGHKAEFQRLAFSRERKLRVHRRSSAAERSES